MISFTRCVSIMQLIQWHGVIFSSCFTIYIGGVGGGWGAGCFQACDKKVQRQLMLRESTSRTTWFCWVETSWVYIRLREKSAERKVVDNDHQLHEAHFAVWGVPQLMTSNLEADKFKENGPFNGNTVLQLTITPSGVSTIKTITIHYLHSTAAILFI